MIRTGNSCDEAMEKACSAKVFGGNTVFFAPKLKQFDADTRGVDWALYKDKGADSDFLIMVSKI